MIFFQNSKSEHRNNERGNVLLYILIAVMLLGALSYAVSSAMQGGSVNQLEGNRAEIIAGEIIEYSNIMASAVAQLRLRGVDEDELCFDHTSWGANDYNHAACADNYNRIFHISGGGLTWVEASREAMAAAATPDNLWHIYGDNEVNQVGSTCGAARCADLILVVDELNEVVCEKINDALSVTNPAGDPPVHSAMGETRYIGAFGYAQTIGDEAGSAVLTGRQSGCFENTANTNFAFYRVLIAR